jgi:hypothetical protein
MKGEPVSDAPLSETQDPVTGVSLPSPMPPTEQGSGESGLGTVARVTRRVGWGLGDQMLSSSTNFIVGLLVARTLPPGDFGAFSIAFVTYALALGASRALASEPLSVRYSAVDDTGWRRGVRSATGLALAMGSVVAAVCLAAGWLLDGSLQAAFLMLGVSMPGLILQDAWRFAFFAGRKERRAFVNDLVWAIVLVPSLALLIITERATVGSLILAWGGAGSIAAVAGIFQSRVLPSPSHTLSWLREQRALAPRFLGEFAVSSGTSQLTVYLLGGIAGLTQAAALRAGQLLLGPLNVMFMAAGLVAVPETVRFLAASPGLFRRASALLSIGLAAIVVAWGTIALLLPARLGMELVGENWGGARAVLLPLTIAVTAYAGSLGAMVGLRAMAAARRSLKARSIVAVVTLVAGVIGASLADARGVAWGMAVAGCLELFVWWGQFTSAANEHPTTKRVSRSDRPRLGDGLRRRPPRLDQG